MSIFIGFFLNICNTLLYQINKNIESLLYFRITHSMTQSIDINSTINQPLCTQQFDKFFNDFFFKFIQICQIIKDTNQNVPPSIPKNNQNNCIYTNLS